MLVPAVLLCCYLLFFEPPFESLPFFQNSLVSLPTLYSFSKDQNVYVSKPKLNHCASSSASVATLSLSDEPHAVNFEPLDLCKHFFG